MLAGVFLLLAATVPAQTIRSAADDTVLKHVVIFGRHGVRAPVMANADLGRFSIRPFPDFGVPAGYLTEHGRQASVLLGSYFRQYLLHEGLLSGNAAVDVERSYFRANSIQRSNVTAAALATGMFGGAEAPVHSYPLGQVDPVFDPVGAKVATIDAARAAAEAQGIYHSGPALASAYAPELSLIRSVLFGYARGTQPPPATPDGLVDPTSQPFLLAANRKASNAGSVIDVGGLLSVLLASDPFVMEYAEGLPLRDVGWGQLSLEEVSQQTRVGALGLILQTGSPYLARVQSSNAASHVLRSMEQAIINDKIGGAFGDARSRLNVIISSDVYIVGLAGLLGLHWMLPGYQADFCPPGGALVFELRQSKTSEEYFVRAFYTAQTWDQLRNLTPLTLDRPPASMQLTIPIRGVNSGPGLDVRFQSFQRHVRASMDPSSVQDPMRETPPGVLTGVPLR